MHERLSWLAGSRFLKGAGTTHVKNFYKLEFPLFSLYSCTSGMSGCTALCPRRLDRLPVVLWCCSYSLPMVGEEKGGSHSIIDKENRQEQKSSLGGHREEQT